MFITPMNRLGGIADIGNIGTGSQTAGMPVNFQDVFNDAIQSVKDTEKAYTEGTYLMATGQIDDTYTVPIMAAKAQLSVDLLVQLRSKALESYTEIMRINL